MKPSLRSRFRAAAVSALLLLAVAAPRIATAAEFVPLIDAPSAYCLHSGGVVEVRQAYFGTNNANPLVLADKAAFCRFQSADKSSRIYVLTSTLYAALPTLAALAYYSKTPLGKGCTGNPASCYCSQLGGTDLFGGINAAGGAWVLKGSVDEDLDACIFPDLSSIDSWGLAYHSAGIIRGKDLSKVLRYHNPKA